MTKESQVVAGFENFPKAELSAQGFGDDFLNFDLLGDGGNNPPKQNSSVPKKPSGPQQFNLL